MCTLSNCGWCCAALLAGAILLGTIGAARAGEGWETQPYGAPAHLLPWNQPEYRGYTETAKPPAPPPVVNIAPERYTITINLLPHKPQGVDPNIAVIMAHLPEHAQVWFNDKPTTSKGTTRYFESPPLTPGKRYVYSVRVAWHENGKWVHKIEKVPVSAGEMRCLYLSPADKKETITANLSKLSEEDRKLAEAQKYCPVHPDDELGSMGVPAKIAQGPSGISVLQRLHREGPGRSGQDAGQGQGIEGEGWRLTAVTVSSQQSRRH